jgi:hypothetical protein
VGFGGLFCVLSYIAPTLTRVAGLPDRHVPLVLAVFGAGMILGNLTGAWLADRSLTAPGSLNADGHAAAMAFLLSYTQMTRWHSPMAPRATRVRKSVRLDAFRRTGQPGIRPQQTRGNDSMIILLNLGRALTVAWIAYAFC